MILNPWLILCVVGSLLATHGVAFMSGRTIQTNIHKAEQLAATNQAIKLANQQRHKDQAIEKAAAQTQERTKVIYRTIKEKVYVNIEQNPDYSRCELDANGLRYFNADALPAETAPREPDDRVRSTGQSQ